MNLLRSLSMLAIFAAAATAEPNARMTATHAKRDFELTLDPKAGPWKSAPSIDANFDPMGKPASPGDKFTFKIVWTPANLYFLFVCPYESLNLKSNPSTTEETNKLWEWDVTEVFIAGDPKNIYHYRELQVSPQGEWVDLDIDRKNPKPEGGWKWNAGMQVKAKMDTAQKVWYGAMKVPFSAINGEPGKAGLEFPINVYRLTGANPKRVSTMWTPTQNRSHHTPEMFGRLVLGK